MTMEESLHDHIVDAIDWVKKNTDNVVYRDPTSKTVIRIDANGSVFVLDRVDDYGKFYWSRCRKVL